jgi:predicted ATPase
MEEAPRDRTSSAPFVGREDELDLLELLYTRAVAERAPHLVTITGELGVGKSRLLGELVSRARARGEAPIYLHGRCLPFGMGVSFSPLGEIFRVHAGILASDAPERTRELLADAVARDIDQPADREWVVSRLAPLVVGERAASVPETTGRRSAESGAGVERTEWFAAWQRYLEAVAAKRPVVLAVEDLQWAERPVL